MLRRFQQDWPLPAHPLPIVIIGAGNIVNDAHLPAYRKAGYQVAGIFDIDTDRAAALSRSWNIGKVFGNGGEIAGNGVDCVYDIATPPSSITDILPLLPDGAAVLIQKPMGEDLAQAGMILDICRAKKLNAAVNFQLRFSPMMLAVRDALLSNVLGEIFDLEVHVNISTPWATFPFLRHLQRVEIAVHSIHYLDLIRSLVGEPRGVFSRSLGDPRVADLAQTRTSVILDYGDRLRALLSVNHNHDFGPEFQAATIRFEGSNGCAMARLGLLLNYPHGEADELWACETGGDWQQIALQGRWFPDAFANIMGNLQRFHAGDDQELLTNVEDAFRTMKLVETCFVANRTPPVTL